MRACGMAWSSFTTAHVRESIPAAGGPVTLAYPKWIPGEHGPTGPITDLVGLTVSAGGKPVEWKRVPTEMWSFTCDVPAGASSLDVAFDYVAPLSSWTTATAGSRPSSAR